MLSVYPDVLAGFQLVEFPLEKSTFFRFALRQEYDHERFLSQSCHQVEDVKEMMTQFMKKSKETLLFLKNIRTISFYELTSKNGRDQLVCLKRECAKEEREFDAANRVTFYEEFKEAFKNDSLSFTQISFRRIQYTIRIQTYDENTP